MVSKKIDAERDEPRIIAPSSVSRESSSRSDERDDN
jgi:hypothetical protein